MSTITLELPRPHSAQAQVLAEAQRFNVLACGRRFGKTTLGIDRLIQPALEGQPVGWFSPTYKMLAEVWRELRTVLYPVTARPNAQERRLELVTGGVVDCWSLDSADTCRGRKYKRVIVDEAGMVPTMQEAWQEAIRPTLTDLLGDAWFLSTPKGLGYFHTLFQQGQDRLREGWASWQLPTAANPYIDPAEIAAAREDMTEQAFAQEYLAQFVNWSGAVFRHLLEATTGAFQDHPEPGHHYVIGADWGRSVDYSVFLVVDATARCVVDMDRSRQIDYTLQRERLKVLYERWRPTTVIAESNSMGLPIIEQLVRDGLRVQPFQTTNASKAEAIEALALAFERGEIRIPNDPTLLGELQAYEAQPLPSGLMRYSAPSGGHDDCVIALALAWQGVKQRLTITSGADLARLNVELTRGSKWGDPGATSAGRRWNP